MSPTGFRQKALVGIVVPAGGFDKPYSRFYLSVVPLVVPARH